MTDNEIIKAFELCFAKRGTILTCGKCPYHNFGKLCKVKRDKDALDLINRIQDEKQALINGQETLQNTIVEQKAEIERLKTRNDELNALNKTASIEAIKGFAERYEKEVLSLLTSATLDKKDGIYACLNILTEMVGDSND